VESLLENPPCKEVRPPDIQVKSALRAAKKPKIRVLSPRSGDPAAIRKGQARFFEDSSCFKIRLHSKSVRMLDGKMRFDNILGELCDGTPRHNTSTIEDRKIVGEFLAKIEVLLNQQNGHGALAAEQIESRLDFIF
jgi:hypothetical protein